MRALASAALVFGLATTSAASSHAAQRGFYVPYRPIDSSDRARARAVAFVAAGGAIVTAAVYLRRYRRRAELEEAERVLETEFERDVQAYSGSSTSNVAPAPGVEATRTLPP